MRRKGNSNSSTPSSLSPGSTVALVAPAFRFNRDLMEQGRTFLETKYGVKTVALDNVFDQQAYFAGSDERRAEELFHWLTNPDVDAVLAIRGGYGCARIYPELLRRLKSHRNLKPKIVMGYSDLTILLNGLYQDFGWTTFHGPVIAGRPFRTPVAIEEDSFRKCLFSDEPLGPITDDQMTTLVRGNARGKLVGGCLSLLVSSLGTDYEIDTHNKVLFFEDVDEKPYRIDRMLTQLLHAGKLDKVRGVIIGQLAHCDPAPESSDPSQTTAIQAVRLAIGSFLEERGIPAVYDFPAGHGSLQITFPIGCEVEIHADKNTPKVIFNEAGAR